MCAAVSYVIGRSRQRRSSSPFPARKRISRGGGNTRTQCPVVAQFDDPCSRERGTPMSGLAAALNAPRCIDAIAWALAARGADGAVCRLAGAGGADLELAVRAAM